VYGHLGKGIDVLGKNILCSRKNIFFREGQSRDFSREFGEIFGFSGFVTNSEENCEDRQRAKKNIFSATMHAVKTWHSMA
jgi:hypothetical protein